MRSLAAGVCTALALTACGTSGGPPAEPGGTTAAPGGTTAAPTTPAGRSDPVDDQPLEPIADGDVADSQAAGDEPPVVLTDVRSGAHRGFDRVVFEVAGDGRVGWQAGYIDAPRSQGSGKPVEVPGQVVLEIILTNVALPGDAPSGVRPWSGPDRHRPDGATVLESLVAGTLFEGRYTFFAGLDQRRPFAVGMLTAPQRVVVDLMAERPESAVALSQSCAGPAGFSISYPEGWAVNSGETVPACTRFAPDPFRVPAGTDARVGAVTASVESVPFDRIASSQLPEVLSRTETTVDGRRALRIERVSTGEGLYPDGVGTTSYVVDLEPRDDGPRTLVVNTVGLPQFDYARNVRVLDRMIETVEISRG